VLSRRWFAWIRPGEPHRDRCGSGPGTPDLRQPSADHAGRTAEMVTRHLRPSLRQGLPKGQPLRPVPGGAGAAGPANCAAGPLISTPSSTAWEAIPVSRSPIRSAAPCAFSSSLVCYL